MSYSFTTLLPDRGLIELRGPEARKFLQDLVTNSLEPAEPGRAFFAGLLTPKGKILVDFFIYLRDSETLWIDCPLTQVGELVKRLTLYKLRAKVEISDRSEDHVIGALWGEPAGGGMQTPAVLARYTDPRHEPMGARFVIERHAREGLASAAEVLGDAAYHGHRISLAIPQGGLDYAYGETFPHEACYDELHGVDFRKGCYVGQEVVSRMHHKGTAKTRVVGIEASEPFEGGGVEILAGDKPVGQLGSVDGTHGVALVRLDRVDEALRQGTPLRVGDLTLTVRQPPWAQYQVPSSGTGF